MAHRDIHLTNKSRDLLNAMPSKTFEAIMDYIDNPVLRAAADAGEALHLATPGSFTGTWMDLRLDKNANIALSLWEVDRERFQEPPWPLSPKAFRIWSLPKGDGPTQSENFRRTLGVVSGLAQAARGATGVKDMGAYSEIIQELGKYLPWIKQMQALSDRLHGPDAAPHYLHLVLRQLNLYPSQQNSWQESMSPRNAVQALLGMHASLNADPTPSLFALEYPDSLTSYLFVQHVQVDAVGDQISDGIHAWLDANGMPLCYNDLKRTPLFKDSNLAQNADPALTGLTWPPKEDTQRNNWADYVNEYNTPQSRALVETLAQVTPRKISAEESRRLANAWLSAATIHDRWGPENLHDGGGHNTLALWGKHMTDCLASQYPAEHAVLTDLMPPMTNLDTIEEWRMQMRAMTTAPSTPPQELELPTGLLNNAFDENANP